MSDSSLPDVRAAVYALLSGDVTLQELADFIGDRLPEGSTVRRACLLGAASETPNDTFGDPGRSVRLTIDSIAEDTQDRTGWKAAEAIDSRAIALLDGATLTVANRVFVLCQFESSQHIDADPWRHVATDFRIETEAT